MKTRGFFAATELVAFVVLVVAARCEICEPSPEALDQPYTTTLEQPYTTTTLDQSYSGPAVQWYRHRA